MKKTSFLTYVILIFSFISCNGMGKSNGSIQNAVEKMDSCKLDAKNKYEVYIPHRNSDEKLPLLVIIDAHGSGKFALNKFKLSADKYPAIIVSSDYVKNGFEGFENAIQTLIDDVNQKYPVNKTLFLAGFSGGARMALGYASNHTVDGLILCGALADAQQLKSLACPVFSISGMDDFNFMETAQYLFQDETTPSNLKIELTNDSHGWPDSLMLANTFGFLQLSKVEKSSELTDYCNVQLSRIDSLKQKGDFLKAKLIARNMAFTTPFNTEKDFNSIYNGIKINPNYVNQLNRLGETLNLEMQIRQSYLKSFQEKDIVWWKTEISKLEKSIKTEKDEFTCATYKRVKAFLGIVCYSYSKQAVTAHSAEMLDKIISIYSNLEPENPDMFYYGSFLLFWKNDYAKTVIMLNKSRKAGFTDINQLKKDFPASITSLIK